MLNEQSLRFFISSNSGEGFYSLYDRVFQNESFDKIYVIHGGPGTGKSTLMRRILEKAKEIGASCQEILCSSDPDSLDGLIISLHQKKIGILDGTAPHPRIISAPGATEELWNLGEFWDNKKLERSKNEIFKENKRKKESYRSAYALLHAAKSCHFEIKHMLESSFDAEKAQAQIKRAISKLTLKGPSEIHIFRAFSMKGESIQKDAFSSAQKQVLLCGKKHTAELYLQYLKEGLQKERIKHTVFLSPLNEKEIDGIYIDEIKTVYLWEEYEQTGKESKKMHMRRFIPHDSTHVKSASFIRQVSALEENLIHAALSALRTAGQSHFILEDIYKKCMNFSQMQEKSKKYAEDVLSHLKN